MPEESDGQAHPLYCSKFDEILYDMASGGEQRSWRHLKMNAWGETPTRVLEDGTYSKFPVNATPLNERYEQLDQFWKRWKERPSFRVAYADGGSGLAELEHLRTDAKG